MTAKPYKIRFGTLHEPGPTRDYRTVKTAKDAIRKELKGWRPWCQRYNVDGLEAIDDALEIVGGAVIHRTVGRIELCLDAHTDTWLAVEYWHEEL